MARPRKYDEEDTLERILDLFWATGFDGTSLSDIVAATGLQKGSLYGTFGDKQTMYLRALAAYDARHVRGAIEMMAARPGREALSTLMHFPADAVRTGDHRGCFLCNSVQERDRLDDDSAALAYASKAGLRVAILDALERGWPGERFTSADADVWLALYFGLRVLARSGASAGELSEVANGALRRFQASLTVPG